MASWQMHFLRNTSKDITIYDTPATLYTDSTTLTTGMTLYNNTGTDTGLAVGTVNQDGTFEIGAHEINFVLNKTLISDIVLDGVTHTSDFTIKLSEGNHSLVVNGDYTSAHISSDQGTATTIVNGVTNSGPYVGTLNISSAGLVVLTANSYDFGTCPITLTIYGSMTSSGGGSN